MSGHDPELDAFGFIGLQADAESIQKATAAIERMLREHWKRLGNRQDQARDDQTKRTREYFKEQSRIQEEAFKKDERRDVERLKRLKARQAAGYKEAADLRARDLSDQKAADKQAEIAAKQHSTRTSQVRDHRLKEERREERRNDFEALQEQKRRNKTTLESQRKRNAQANESQRQANRIQTEQERRVTKELEAENKIRLAQTKAAGDKSVAATKGAWSVTRAIVETSTRFISSSIQSHYARRFAKQQQAEAREAGSLRDSEADKQGILRRSFSSQERISRSGYSNLEQISTRSLAKQEGAIVAFQRTTQKGLIGSLLRTRTLLLAGGGFLTARAIFGPVADYQQTKIAFESLLGSAVKADRFLGRLRKFAEKTPFTFEGVAEGARRLLAVGFAARDVTPALTDIGNVAATLGVGEEEINGVIRALGQMKGKGKASAEELQQISEQLPGFSAVEAIAKSLGITTAEAFEQMRAGAISGDEGVQAILQGMREFPGAAGSMDRQSRTLNGRLSTLHDTFQNLLIDSLTPVVEILADLTGVFTDLITSLFRGSGVWEVVRSGLLGIAVAMGAVLAVKGAVAVFELMGTALTILAGSPILVGLAALGALIAILIREVPVVGDSFEEAFGIISDSVSALWALLQTGDFEAFFDRLKTVAEDVGEALTPAVDFVRDWVADVFAGLSESVPRLAEQLREQLEPVVTVIRDFVIETFENLQEWLDAGGVGRLADIIGDAVETAFKQALAFLSTIDWGPWIEPALIAVGLAIAFAVGGWPALIIGALIAASPRLRKGLTKAFKNVKDFFKEFFDGIDWAAVGLTVLDGIRQIGEFLGGPVMQAIFSKPVLLALLAIGAAVVAALGALVLGFIQGLAQSLPNITDVFADVAEDLQQWVSDLVDDLEGPLGGLAQVLIAPFEFAIREITSVLRRGGEILRGIVDVIAGIFTFDFGRILEGLNGIFGGIIGLVTDRFSNLGSLIADVVGGIGQTIWGVLRGGFRFVRDNIGDWIQGILDFFRNLPRHIVQAIAGIGHVIWNALSVAFNFVLDQIENIIDSILGFFGDLPGRLADALRDAVDAVLPGGDRGEDPSRPGGGGGDRGVDPSGGINANSGTPRGFFGTTPAGGGPTTLPFDIAALSMWQEDVIVITNNIRAAFETMHDDVVETVDDMGERLEHILETTMRNMEGIGNKGADRVANAISNQLRDGVREVSRIVAGYASALATSLNPLLEGIGATKIAAPVAGANILRFARGGIPNIAGPSDGPIVHVYNEGSSGRGSAHGEAYIPFDPTHRSRAKSIADRTVGKLGGRVQWFADGGYTGGFPNLTGDTIGLVPEFARRLSMFGTRVGSAFHVNSGFRSYAEQVRLYQAYLAGTGNLAAPPGSSMHEFGLAADGPHWGNKSPNLNGLKYPVTGEPWHTEPVEGRGLADGAFANIVPIAKPPDAGQRGQLSRVAAAMMQYVYQKALDYASSISFSNDASIAGGSPASRAQASAWILEAMGIVGAPSNWLAPLLARAWQESGFDPRAINLWDSNAAAGNPSKGLFQTIATTFAAYALPGHGNIWNPVDNAIAAIRYIIARYGSPFNLPSGGYRNGGVIDQPTWALMGEGGHKEVVLPLENRSRLRSLLSETGLWADILAAASGPSVSPVEIPGGPSMGMSTGGSRRIDLNLTIDGDLGNVDPVLYSELAGAVRSGVADGISRAEALEERWS